MSSASEILVIGGGAIALSIAIELRLRGAKVGVLSRDFRESAAHAAAGMLAPQAEGFPPGPMLDLCLRSRDLYPDWISKLEELTGTNAGYWPCGILSAKYRDCPDRAIGEDAKNGLSPESQSNANRIPPEQINSVASKSQAESSLAENSITPAYWLGENAIRQYQPGLGSDVAGGWWFPEDGQVDNRALAKTLWTAALELGVDLRDGVAVEAIQQRRGRVSFLRTTAGEMRADRYVMACGAWSFDLLPVPVYPKKGQMLSVRPFDSASVRRLQRILYAAHTYIVPRRDGQIVIGATSEDAGFRPGNTPEGIQALLGRAIRLYPELAEYQIEELWWGFRPATADDLPILGPSQCENLYLATGHYRNGILLAPATAGAIAELILNQKSDPLLEHFHWERFLTNNQNNYQNPGGSQNGDLAKEMNNKEANNAASQKSDNTTMTLATPATPATPAPASVPTASLASFANGDSPLTIAGRPFGSRLFTGTGKYRNMEEMQQAIAASGCNIVTVAVRRVQTKAPGHEGLAEAIDWGKIWMLPNTAGCKTAEEAIRVARLGREMAKLLGQEDNNFVKLEVIPDATYLLPDPIGTLEAAEQLVKEGFAVLPYINADPILAKRLEEAGCATVMPLGSPIGSGQGIKNQANIEIIIANAKVPVVVDAGLGVPSEAAAALEMGADAVLINTAIARAQNPGAMARAMALAVEAGRLAYLSGRIPVKATAIASSPLTGTISS